MVQEHLPNGKALFVIYLLLHCKSSIPNDNYKVKPGTVSVFVSYFIWNTILPWRQILDYQWLVALYTDPSLTTESVLHQTMIYLHLSTLQVPKGVSEIRWERGWHWVDVVAVVVVVGGMGGWSETQSWSTRRVRLVSTPGMVADGSDTYSGTLCVTVMVWARAYLAILHKETTEWRGNAQSLEPWTLDLLQLVLSSLFV